ncbi:MAG: hypothetical protein ACREMY_32990, partial [bacterium]
IDVPTSDGLNSQTEDANSTTADRDAIQALVGHGAATDGAAWYLYAAYDLNGDGSITNADRDAVTANLGLSLWPPQSPLSLAIGQGTRFAVTARDTNAQPMTYTATGLPSGSCFNGLDSSGSPGTCGTREFSWTPGAGQGGGILYTITFNVSDGSLTGSTSIMIRVP